jgi:hypothetical protein
MDTGQAAMPEESGWYFCVATSGFQLLESGLYVEVVNTPSTFHADTPAPSPRTPEKATTTLSPVISTEVSSDELHGSGDRFRIYKTFEGLAQTEVINFFIYIKICITKVFFACYGQIFTSNVSPTGRQLSPLSSVLYGIISGRRSVLAA